MTQEDQAPDSVSILICVWVPVACLIFCGIACVAAHSIDRSGVFFERGIGMIETRRPEEPLPRYERPPSYKSEVSANTP